MHNTRQGRRAYTYEPTDYHFLRQTPREHSHIPFADDPGRCGHERPSAAAVVVLVAAAALVVIQSIKLW